jgi:hypothetical protein
MAPTPILRAPTPDDPSSVIYPASNQPVTNPANPAIPSAPASTPASATPTSSQNDAYAYLQSVLRLYGLDSLSGWAWDQIIAGNSPEMIVQLLYERPEFKSRFPAIDARRAKGLPPISVNQILEAENQIRSLNRQWGLPYGMMESSDDIQSWLADDKSVLEYADRIQLAAQDYFSMDPIAKSELDRLYNLTPGQHIGYILSPNTALPLIKNELSAAALSAASIRSSYGPLSTSEAESLAGIGVNPNQAQQTFSSLSQAHELFTPLPGEQAALIDRSAQIRASFFGDAAATAQIANRVSSRVAAFQGGGRFASSQRGISGLGTLDQ